MRIFVTGGSGFVGGAVVRTLAPRHHVAGLSRSPASDGVLREAGATPVRGDLASADRLVLNGFDAIVHCAAFVEEWGPLAAYEDINVRGTARLLAAAKARGVRRFVHVGTEAALFRGQNMRDIDETHPLAPDSPFPYSSSKAKAELAVKAANDPAGGFSTIVIRPRLVWGPGDKTVLPVVKAMAASGRFRWIDGGRAMTSTTHVANLVHAIDLALTKGAAGESYFVVDGTPLAMRDFLSRYLRTAGVDLGGKSAPGWLVRGIAGATEPLWRLVGSKSPPPITRFTAAIMSRDCTINDAKARRDLGYAPVMTVDQGLERLAACA